VYTIENLVHFLHQLAAIIWLGACLLAVNVFGRY
jgi:putative copper export protein